MNIHIVSSNHDPDKINLKVEHDKEMDIWRIDAKLKKKRKTK